MAFDPVAFLRQNNIPYVEEGRNVKSGNVNIKCLLCGNSDPSEHLGINVRTGAWACWRNRRHKGSPVALVALILHCSYEAARLIVYGEGGGERGDFIPLDELASGTYATADAAAKKRAQRLALPEEFRPLSSLTLASKRFTTYLRVRGFFSVGVYKRLHKHYRIMYAVSGRYSNRLIFPYYLDGELVTWTARSITASSLRYLTLPAAQSVLQPRETLYNYDNAARGGRRLCIVEGPFDVLKVDHVGRAKGVRAVGMSGATITEDQVALIDELAPSYDEVVCLPDREDLTFRLQMQDALGFLGKKLRWINLPTSVKDPGDLLATEVRRILCN